MALQRSHKGSTRRQARREEEISRRRSDAIAAAASVIGEKGFHGAQMTEIAAASELSLATLYSIFEGKEEIYEQVIASAADAIRDEVRGKVLPISDPRERLLALIDSLFACFDANRELLRIYATGTHGLPWRMRQSMGEHTVDLYYRFIDWVTEIACEAKEAGDLDELDPETFAVSLTGAVTATAARWVELKPTRKLTAATPSVRALFARALGGGAKR
jgi:AcrR family transcriptional regulator